MGGGGPGGGGDCGDGVLRVSSSMLCLLGGLLTVGLTSSAAMAPVSMHGTDVLTLIPVTAVPLEAPADGDGVEMMSSAGRTTAGSRGVVTPGTLTQTTDTTTGSTQWQAWGLAGSGGDGRCQVSRESGWRGCKTVTDVA